MGTIIGMAGGAAIGAVIGSQADKAQADRDAAYRKDRIERRSDFPEFVTLISYKTLVATALHIMGNEVYDYSNPSTDYSRSEAIIAMLL